MTPPHPPQDDLICVESYMGHTIEICFDWFTTSPLLAEGYQVEHWVPGVGFPQLNKALMASGLTNNLRMMLKNNDPVFLPKVYRIISAKTKFSIRAVHINMTTGNLTAGRCWPGHSHSNGAIWKQGRQLSKSMSNTLAAHNRHHQGDRYFYTIDTSPEETFLGGFTTPEKALHHATRHIDALVRADQQVQPEGLRLESTRPRLHLVRNSGAPVEQNVEHLPSRG